MAAVYVGIDVAKAHLDRALSPATAEPWRDTNDPRGIRRVVARLQPLPVTLIVLEAT